MDGLQELDVIGSLIAGKYRLESVLGRGGMGTVYRATHTWTSRPVAVKLLHHEHANDAASVSRFLREARAAASVRHPNAVDVLDMGQDEKGTAYLVLELLEGETLGAALAMRGPFSLRETACYLAPVMEALEELHRAGVVHRDFKPANIFLARAPKGAIVPKLLDFGVAKVLDANQGLATTTGIVVGTPAYMSPEQAAGTGNIGPWTDIWAVGAVLYECLTGELPFNAPTPSLMLVDVMTKRAPRVDEKRADVPASAVALVERALSKTPEDRFPSVAAMVQALCDVAGLPGPSPVITGFPSSDDVGLADTHHALRSTPPRSASPGLREPPATGPTATGRLRASSSKRSWMFAGVSGLVVALGVGGYLLADRGSLPPPAPPVAGDAVRAQGAPSAVVAPPVADNPTTPAAPAGQPDSAPPMAQQPAPVDPPADDIPLGADMPPEDAPKPLKRGHHEHHQAVAAPDAAKKPPAKEKDDSRVPNVQREW
jgi:serine/threonine protein kinase